MVTGDDESATLKLNAATGASGIPGPGWVLNRAGDLDRLGPGGAIVLASGYENAVVVTAERQPEDTGSAVHNRTRIADRDLRRAAFLVDQLLPAPGLAAVEAAFEKQVDVAVIP